MPTIVTTSNAADFLAVVPHLVGFEPQNSIVFVAFHGARTCGAMRFDLPEAADGGADEPGSTFYKRVATTLVGMLSKLPGVESVVPVVYTADSFARSSVAGSSVGSTSVGSPSVGGGLPRASFVRAVIARFEFSGFDVRDALCVAADGWGSYLDDRCPTGGRSLADIAGSRVFDDLAEHERRPLGAIDRWAALPVVDEGDRHRVAKGIPAFTSGINGRILIEAGEPDDDDIDDDDIDDDRNGDDRDGDDRDGDDAATSRELRRAKSRLLREIPAVLERILDRGAGELETDSAAFVISLARLPALRDVVMLQWAFDIGIGEDVLSDARWFAHGIPADELDSAGLMLGRGPRPDPERVERAIDVLKRTAALAPREQTPPLLSVLAWLSWALGRSSVAKIFVTAAEEVDPCYGFAELMHTVLERGMLPEWAFAGNR